MFHFKKDGHVEGDMRVVVLEEVEGKDDMYRLTVVDQSDGHVRRGEQKEVTRFWVFFGGWGVETAA